LGESYRVALGLAFDLEDHEAPFADGSVSTQRVPVSLTLSRQLFRRTWLRANLGVELLAMFERAHTRGLDATGEGVRVRDVRYQKIGSDLFATGALVYPGTSSE
jgi:hypothetical protein